MKKKAAAFMLAVLLLVNGAPVGLAAETGPDNGAKGTAFGELTEPAPQPSAPLADGEEAAEDPSGVTVTFFDEETGAYWGEYTTDAAGCLSASPEAAPWDGFAFVGWWYTDQDGSNYLLTTARSDAEGVATYAQLGDFTDICPVEQFTFGADAALYLTCIPQDLPEIDVEPLAIEDIDNNYTLVFPVKLNGFVANLTLSANLKADIMDDAFSTAQGNFSVLSDNVNIQASVKAIKPTAKDKIALTIEATYGESRCLLDVKIVDSIYSGGRTYEVKLADTAGFVLGGKAYTGKFVDGMTENTFTATVEEPADMLTATEMTDFTFYVSWVEYAASKRPDKIQYTLYKNSVSVPDAKIVEQLNEEGKSKNPREYKIADLPKYDDEGQLIDYVVKQTMETKDYLVFHNGSQEADKVSSGQLITNRLIAPVTMTKLWYDGKNSQSTRPSAEDWAKTLTLSREYTDGEGRTHTETFTATYNSDEGIVVFTNTKSGSVITATVAEGTGREEAKWTLETQRVDLATPGGLLYTYYFGEKLSDKNKTWPDGNGNYYSQSIQSGSVLQDEGKIFTGDTSISLLKNETSFDFTKVWNDNDPTKRPSLTFYLYRYAIKPGVEEFTLSPVSNNDYITIENDAWTDVSSDSHVEKAEGEDTWAIHYASGLPKYDDRGYPYVYFALEQMPQGSDYQGTVDNSSTDVYESIQSSAKDKYILCDGIITNEKSDKFKPTVTKRWETGDLLLPGEENHLSATFRLEKKVGDSWVPVEGVEPLTIDGFTLEVTSKMGAFAEVPRYENGTEIQYRIREISATFMDKTTREIQYAADEIDKEYPTGTFTAGKYNFTTTYSKSEGELLVTNTLDNAQTFGISKKWAPGLPYTPADGEGDTITEAEITVSIFQNDQFFDLKAAQGANIAVDEDDAVVGYKINDNGTLTIRSSGDFHLALLNLPKFDAKGTAYRYTMQEVDCSAPYANASSTYKTEQNYTVGDHSYSEIPTITFENVLGDGDGDVLKLAAEKRWFNSSASRVVDHVTVAVYYLADDGAGGVTYTQVPETEMQLNEGNYWYQAITFKPYIHEGLPDKNINHYVIREVSIDTTTDSYPVVYDGEQPDWLLDASEKPEPSWEAGDGYVDSEDYYWQVSTRLLAENEVPDGVPAQTRHVPTYRICNRWLGYVNMEITKTWKIGGSRLSGNFRVLKNGQELFTFALANTTSAQVTVDASKPAYIEVSVEETSATSTSVVLKNFPKFDENGLIISYAIAEISVQESGADGSEIFKAEGIHNVATVAGKRLVSSLMTKYEFGPTHHSDDWMRVSCSNTFMDSSALDVYKVWRDGYGEQAAAGESFVRRPDIFFTLYRQSAKPGSQEEVVSRDCVWDTEITHWLWKCTFEQEKFPMYDLDGYDYTYYVKETITSDSNAWNTAYFPKTTVTEPASSVSATTESSFANPTADAEKNSYAIARFTKLKELNDELTVRTAGASNEVGVVLNYLDLPLSIKGQKIWENLPSWYKNHETDFGPIYLGIIRITNDEQHSRELAEVITLNAADVENGLSFTRNNYNQYSEFGYMCSYQLRELLPKEGNTGTTDTGLAHWEELKSEIGKDYFGYEINSNTDRVTNRYTGAPYRTFAVEKTWDLSAYLENYPHVTEIPYPSVTFTLSASTQDKSPTVQDTVGYSAAVATLTLSGGTLTKYDGQWTSDQEGVSVTYTPGVHPVLKVTVSGDATEWELDDNSSLRPYIKPAAGQPMEGVQREFPIFAPNGAPFVYDVREATIPGYSASTPTSEGDTHTIYRVTNTFETAKSTLEATKTWNDQGDAYGTRPQPGEFYIRLYRDTELIYSTVPSDIEAGETAFDPQKLDYNPATMGNKWTYTFATTEDTPAEFRFSTAHPSGDPYDYQLEEVFADGNTAKHYSVELTDGEYKKTSAVSPTSPALTNSLQTVTLKVDKEWLSDEDGNALTPTQLDQLNQLGYMPEKVGFQVYYQLPDGTYAPFEKADGETVIVEVSWTGLYNSVRNQTLINLNLSLPKFDKNGELYQYAAKEAYVVMAGGKKLEVTYGTGEDAMQGTFESEFFGGVTVDTSKSYSVISNTLKAKKLTFTKYWDDDNNRDSYRPAGSDEYSITLVHGTDDKNAQSVLPLAGNEWTIDQAQLVGEGDAAKLMGVWTYSVTVPEIEDCRAYENMGDEYAWVAHYVPSVSADSDDSHYYFINPTSPTEFEITNLHEPETISVAVAKTWVDQNNKWGLRAPITLQLTQDGSTTVTYLRKDTQTYAVTYSPDRVPTDQTVSASTGNSLTKESTVQLVAENSENATVTWLNLLKHKPKDNENIMTMDPSESYTYAVQETALDGYLAPVYQVDAAAGNTIDAADVTANGTKTVTVTNTLEETQLTAIKKWEGDNNNAYGTRDDVTLVFLLKQNGRFVTLNEDGAVVTTEVAPANAAELNASYVYESLASTGNNQQVTFKNLPKKDGAGTLYTYTVAEYILVDGVLRTTLKDYSTTYTPSGTQTTVTNTLTPGTITLSVDKTWVERATGAYQYTGVTYRPTSIAFTVYYKHLATDTCPGGAAAEWQNSRQTGYAVMSSADGAEATYTLMTTPAGGTELKLPAYSIDNCKILYKAVESDVKGYTGTTPTDTESVEGVDGFTTSVTNTQKTTRLKVTKQWHEAYEITASRPASVTVNVQYKVGANGTWTNLTRKSDSAPVTLVLTGPRWEAELDDLLYEDAAGTKLFYRAVEANVPAGYTKSEAAPTGSADAGYAQTITNSLNELHISKTAVGGDPNTDFTFRVTIAGAAPDQTFPCRIGASDNGVISSGGTVTLKSGQTATIYGIAASTQVTVNEISAQKGAEEILDAYETTITGANQAGTLTIPSATDVAAVGFHNTYRSSGSVVLQAKKVPEGFTLQGNDFSFTLYNAAGEEIATARNDASGAVTFAALTYDESSVDPATHQRDYTYTIRETGTNPDLYTATPNEYTVTVHVVDHLNGTITATPNLSADDAADTKVVFTNTYHATGKITIEGRKVLHGRDLAAGEFTFKLMEGTTEIATATNLADGTFSFELKFGINAFDSEYALKPGPHTYTICEVDDGATDIHYVEDPITIRVVARDVGGGHLDVRYVDEDGTTLTAIQPEIKFENTYHAHGSVTIDGLKLMEGRHPKDEEFTFELWENGEMIDYTQNASDGTFFFNLSYTYDESISADDRGWHTYILKENQAEQGGVTKDKTEFLVKVYVDDDQKGTLETTLYVDDISVSTAPHVTFENRYEASGSITIGGIKTLHGGRLEDGQFTFELKQDDTVIQSVTNDANGNIVFEPITYNESDIAWESGETQAHFTYTVSEVKGDDGCRYDTRVYTVDVTVTDTGTGVLDVSSTIREQGKTVDKITFVNSFPSVELPQTADDFRFPLWVLLQLGSLAAVGILLQKRNRKKN